MRHVLVMTASGSIGLIAVFVVDLLSLLYVALLGDPALTAGVGFATQLLFFSMSVNIGMAIAISATVSRALGAGERARAQKIAGAGLLQTFLASAALTAVLWIWRVPILEFLGARARPLEVALGFLAIVLPSTILLSLGIALQSVMRANGDARRSMMVTLGGALVAACLDPLLIFGFHLGVTGAAISTVVSRLVYVGVGVWGVFFVHRLAAAPRRADFLADIGPMWTIAAPAILTNLAAPAASAYTMRIFAGFGEATVAAAAIIDRLTPVAFGVLFALTGAIGPIIGQNFGARRFDRIRRILMDCFQISTVYVLATWAVLWVCGPLIVELFDARGSTRDLILFFCHIGVSMWLFLAGLFVANTAFNNLGYPFLATLFNWGRATLGTIPFVAWGAHLYGPKGAMLGIVAGAAIFGLAAARASFVVVARLARQNAAA